MDRQAQIHTLIDYSNERFSKAQDRDTQPAEADSLLAVETFLVPPTETLLQLLDLVERGRISQFRERLDLLGAQNPNYHNFIRPLLPLEKEFQLESLETAIKKWL